jgi:hypothetical protein
MSADQCDRDADGASEVLAATLKSLSKRLKALAKKKDADSAQLEVKLARQYVALAAEKRKHDREARRISSELSLDVVLQWARSLNGADQAQLVRTLQQLTTKRSGLA